MFFPTIDKGKSSCLHLNIRIFFFKLRTNHLFSFGNARNAVFHKNLNQILQTTRFASSTGHKNEHKVLV